MGKIMDSFGNHTQTLRILADCPPGWKSGEMLATPLANAYSYGGKIVSFEKPKPHHRIRAEAHVKPLPKAARHTKSPGLMRPCAKASLRAIGMEAAVVLP